MENPDARDMRSPVGTPFALNFSFALNEDKREAIARNNSHWKALSNVSFHVELVSSSIGSFSSELTAKSTVSFAQLCSEGRDQGSTNTGLRIEQQGPKESTPLRRMQSAPSSLMEAVCGVKLSEIPMGEVKDELERKEASRRHTLNNCDEEDLRLAAERLFGCVTSPTKLHSAAFQSSKTKVKNTKKPRRISSFKENSCVRNPRTEHPNPFTSKATTSSGISTQSHRRISINTLKESETEIQSSKSLPTRLVNGSRPLSRRPRFGTQGVGVDRVFASDKRRESSMKRVVSSLLKCFCSDGKSEELEAEIHTPRNPTE